MTSGYVISILLNIEDLDRTTVLYPPVLKKVRSWPDLSLLRMLTYD